MEAYRIADEPSPGTLSHLAVNPIWPLFGMMFGGAWLAWPWFVFNGFAMGSPTRKKEVGIAILGLIGSALLMGGFIVMGNERILPSSFVPYGLLIVLVWKLGISYWLFMAQSRTFDIYTYFGGIARNGVIIVILATFIRGPVLKNVQESLGTLAMLVVR